MTGPSKRESKLQELIDDAAQATQAATKAIREFSQASAVKLREFAADVAGTASERGPEVARKAAEAAETAATEAAGAFARLSERAKTYTEKTASSLPGNGGPASPEQLAAAAEAVPQPAQPEADAPKSEQPDTAKPAGKAAAKPAAKPAAARKTKPQASEDLSALTVAQLREKAKAAGKSGYSSMNKAELVALLS